MKVRLISITKPVIKLDDQMEMTPEGLIAFTARVSSPSQNNLEYEKLLRYCVRKKHWSVFELVDLTFEVITSRGISPQILRHDLVFQEFSQRYSEVTDFECYEARRQDLENRQNSIDDLPEATNEWFRATQEEINSLAMKRYKEALDLGIAKECARFFLPLSTQTKMYVKGSVRNFIHYCSVRMAKETQLEHRVIAQEIWKLVVEQLPTVAKAVEV